MTTLLGGQAAGQVQLKERFLSGTAVGKLLHRLIRQKQDWVWSYVVHGVSYLLGSPCVVVLCFVRRRDGSEAEDLQLDSAVLRDAPGRAEGGLRGLLGARPGGPGGGEEEGGQGGLHGHPPLPQAGSDPRDGGAGGRGPAEELHLRRPGRV